MSYERRKYGKYCEFCWTAPRQTDGILCRACYEAWMTFHSRNVTRSVASTDLSFVPNTDALWVLHRRNKQLAHVRQLLALASKQLGDDTL